MFYSPLRSNLVPLKYPPIKYIGPLKNTRKPNLQKETITHLTCFGWCVSETVRNKWSIALCDDLWVTLYARHSIFVDIAQRHRFYLKWVDSSRHLRLIVAPAFEMSRGHREKSKKKRRKNNNINYTVLALVKCCRGKYGKTRVEQNRTGNGRVQQ